jgi:hypothetical protein
MKLINHCNLSHLKMSCAFNVEGREELRGTVRVDELSDKLRQPLIVKVDALFASTVSEADESNIRFPIEMCS